MFNPPVSFAACVRPLAWLALALGLQASCGAAHAQAVAAPAAACPALLQQNFNRLQDNQPQSLCQYAGRVLLVVNTASYCGYTSQYEGLEAAYAKYKARGLVVLAFPSNDFEQEPGNSQQIGELCFNTYGVQFPIFSKTAVKGAQASPFYQALAKATGKPPAWNFHKYLVDRRGQAVASYASAVTPADAGLTAAIEKLLAER
jgi:glutathione peroxidase